MALSSINHWAEAFKRFCITVGGVAAAVSVFVQLNQFSQILSRQCCLWKPVKIVGLIVLENPPAVGKRVIANIGRLSSPDTSVHLQVPSLAKDQVSQVILPSEPSEPSEISKLLKVINYQAWGSPNIDRCLEALLCWRIGKFSRVINHELVRAAKMAITFLISSLNEISFRTCRCCPHQDFPGSCTHSLHKTWCQILCTMRLQCVSKILTPRRMLQKTLLIAKINLWTNSFQNMYDMP